MNILINMSTLKRGGGENVGLNFLTSFLKVITKHKCIFLVARNSEIYRYLLEIREPIIIVVPQNPIFRILFELLFSRYYLKKYNIDVIYTIFGFGLFPRTIPQIIGSADSNLYYPEVDFWSDYGKISLLKKKLIDKYRILGLNRANAIIFENKALENRYHELFEPGKLTQTILPSISFMASNKKTVLNGIQKYNQNIPKGLFLCGWHLNKNIFMIPEIARELKNMGIPFHIILTAPLDQSAIHIAFNNKCREYSVEDMITIVGNIKKDELEDMYSQIDYVFLLSKLESFSNNIIEAFYFRKLLIISDEEWAKSLCNEAAIYVNRDDPKKIAHQLQNIIESPSIYRNYIEKGLKELSNYPTIDEKVSQELKFVEKVYKEFYKYV